MSRRRLAQHATRITHHRLALAAMIILSLPLSACRTHTQKHANFGIDHSRRSTWATPAPSDQGLESIVVLRSIRESQLRRPSGCASSRTGFEPYATDGERHYTFFAVETNARDGRVVDAGTAQAALLRGCFGATDDRTRQNFHAEIEMGDLAFRGRGECVALAIDVPEHGLISVRCHLVLSELPANYVGGLLTTNTLTSQAPFGGATLPAGYTQASIATLRLWRKR